jgi:hypothetical protein
MCLEGLDLFPPEPSPPAVEEDDDSDEEPATEERIEVRCEPVIVCREPEREWVPGHYETVYEDVWVPPHCEEIFEPEIVGPRAAHADPLGRFAHRMGLIREARSYTVQVPGHCETVRRKVWVEGHYR